MEVTAIAKNIRTSPQKTRLVVDQIKKMELKKAIEILDFVPQKSAKPIKKVILSAVANARNNFNLDENTLAFKEINVGRGISFKRFRPVSRGRAHSISKMTSNILVILSGEVAKKKEEPKQIAAQVKEVKGEEKNGTKS